MLNFLKKFERAFSSGARVLLAAVGIVTRIIIILGTVGLAMFY